MNIENVKLNVLQIIKDVKKLDTMDIGFDEDLSFRGIDSLDMFDIFTRLEDKYHLNINSDEFNEDNWGTINKISENVCAMKE